MRGGPGQDAAPGPGIFVYGPACRGGLTILGALGLTKFGAPFGTLGALFSRDLPSTRGLQQLQGPHRLVNVSTYKAT